MNSNSEKAHVLIQVADRMPDDEMLIALFLETAQTINSSSDYRRVLSRLMEREDMGDKVHGHGHGY